MKKYLIYRYHGLHIKEFNSDIHLYFYVNDVICKYGMNNDYKFKVIYGYEVQF